MRYAMHVENVTVALRLLAAHGCDVVLWQWLEAVVPVGAPHCSQ
jgi:hypothetical protein